MIQCRLPLKQNSGNLAGFEHHKRRWKKLFSVKKQNTIELNESKAFDLWDQNRIRCWQSVGFRVPIQINLYAWKKYLPLTRPSLGLKKLLSEIFFLCSPIFHSSCFPINYENEIFLQFFSNSYSSHMLRRRKEKLKWEKSVREVWKMQTRDISNYFMLCRVQQMFADKPFAKLFVNTSA